MYLHESLEQTKKAIAGMDSCEALNDLLDNIEEHLDEIYGEVERVYFHECVDMAKVDELFNRTQERIDIVREIGEAIKND